MTCSATTLVKNETNLKQKNAKKDVLRFDYLLYFFLTPSHWTAIPSKLDLLIFIPLVAPPLFTIT